MEDKLDLIANKSRKIRLYKIFDLFIRSVLTMFGTVSLVSILMFLNSRFGVSYFSCLMMTCFIPSIYSFVVNHSLEGFDNKIKNMEYELSVIEHEYELLREKLEIKNNDNSSVIEKIELRFDGLSTEKKLELLNYMKNIIPDSNYSEYVSNIDNLEMINLEDMVKEVYSRKIEK